MNRDKIYIKLARYFSGESTESEIHEIKRWLKDDSKNKIIYEEAETIWESTNSPEYSFNADKAWETVNSKTFESVKDVRQNIPKIKYPVFGNPILLKTAASIILFLLLSVAGVNYFYSNNTAADNNSQIIAAGNNEIRKIRLNDGTVVTLNSESSLKVPGIFDGRKRVVELSGEAFFEVSPDKERPFYVKTKTAEIKVVGTKFNVTAWDIDSEVTLAVDEGFVKFNGTGLNENNAVFVSRGEMSTLSNNSPPAAPLKIDVKKYFLFWLNDELNFYNAPLKTVIHRLEMKYNVDIAVKDISILAKHLTADFKNESLHDILNTISIALNLGYSVNQNKIIFNYTNADKTN